MSAIAPLRMEVPVVSREPAAQPAFSALKTSAWFAAFPPPALTALAATGSLRSFAAGQVVLQEGKGCGSVLLIVKGRLRSVRRTAGGREVTLEVHRAGDVLTEALFDPTALMPNDWVASETTLLLFLPREEFLTQLRQVPEAALSVSRDLERRLGRAKLLACDLALSDVQTRLFRALARLAREDGEPGPEGTVIRKCPTQQEIGNEIGACRETVSRMIAELARQELVSLKGRRLTITPQFLARTTVSGAA
jgi:CRP/FNR family transcriptional regulator, cyclic AMP receptor protein